MTGIDILFELDQDIMYKLYNNLKKQEPKNYIEILLEEYLYIAEFLNSSIIWEETEEGSIFWGKIYDKYIKLQK